METKMARERLLGVDFVRAVCAIGIIMFHFACHSVSEFRILYTYANGFWGAVLVAIFFMVSGGMLVYNYEEIGSLKLYYYKRFKSIFPAFYIGFAYYYMETVFALGHPFYMGHPWKLLETLCGMDGYLNYRDPGNYYQIGEWFLGALVLLYILYPLLLWAMKKSVIITTTMIGALYIWMLCTDIFVIVDECNLISCLLSFYMGMLCIRHRNFFLKNNWVLLISLVLTVIISAVALPGPENIKLHILGATLMVVLYRFGEVMMRFSVPARVIGFLGALSYPIFLLQHKIIVKMQVVRNPVTPLGVIVMVILTILVTIVYAMVLDVVTKAVTNSRIYRKIEGWIC